MKLLQNYAWPGNVRELENCLRSAATFSRSDVILPEDLPTEIHTSPSTVLPDASHLETSLISALQDIAKAGIAEGSKQLYDDVVTLLDKTIIELALDECSNNHSKTAELLGISRTTLIKKMKQHGITTNSGK